MLLVGTMTITTMAMAGPEPSQELLELLDKLDQAKKNVATYGVDSSGSVSDEIKKFGMKDEQVEDLNSMADRMFQFLAKAMARIGQSSSQVDIFYNSQLYLLGLPNSLGPLGYFALQGLEDNSLLSGGMMSPDSLSSLRSKRSFGGLAHGGLGLGGLGLGGLGLGGLGLGGVTAAGAGIAGTVAGGAVLTSLGVPALGVPLLLKPLVLKVGKVLLLKKLFPLKKKAPLLGLLGLLGLKKKPNDEEAAPTTTTMHYATTYAPKHYTKTYAPRAYTTSTTYGYH